MVFVYQDSANPNPSGICMCGCGERTQLATYTDSPKGRVAGKPLRYLPRHSNRSFPHSAEPGICRRYLAGETSTALAREFGCAAMVICRVLEQHGVKRRSQQEAQTKHACDHSFFDRINTEEKAYWAGFISSDGCIDDNDVLHIALAARDREHLQTFQQHLRATQPLYEREMRATLRNGEPILRGVSGISIKSRQLCSGLSAYGIVPRKTYTMEWPDKLLSADVLHHYLRGLSDGDGWFTSVKSNYVPKHGIRATNYHWGFVGTESMCLGAQRYLIQNAHLQPAKLCRPAQTDSRIKRFSYGGNKQVARIARLLYSDATVYLPRKRAIVEHLL